MKKKKNKHTASMLAKRFKKWLEIYLFHCCYTKNLFAGDRQAITQCNIGAK